MGATAEFTFHEVVVGPRKQQNDWNLHPYYKKRLEQNKKPTWWLGFV